MSANSISSEYYEALKINTATLPESNANSLDANNETDASGLFIQPSTNVPGRPSDITGYVLTASTSEGKVEWGAVGSEMLPEPLQSIADLDTLPNQMLYTVNTDEYNVADLSPYIRDTIFPIVDQTELATTLGYLTPDGDFSTSINAIPKIASGISLSASNIFIDASDNLTGVNNVTLLGDLLFTQNINNVSALEFSQLSTIDSVTITNSQWQIVGNLDQDLTTTSTPTFFGLSADDEIITQVANPLNPTDAANKFYVDSTISSSGGTPPLESVDLATIVNLTDSPVYLDVTETLTSTGDPGSLTIDGEIVSVGQRVLVKNQADPRENGIYDVTDDGGTPGPNWVLTRSSDFNQAAMPLQAGTSTFVNKSPITSNSSSTWTLQTIITTINPLLDNVDFTQTGGSFLYTAGLGIDATQLESEIIELDITSRFSFLGNELELETVTVPFGGTGLTSLTSGNVLIGQGAAAVDVSKAAPTGAFVGTTDGQILTNKVLTNSTNNVTASSLFSDSGANTISLNASANPSAGQVLTAINGTSAEWANSTSPLTAGLGIDATQLTSEIIQLDTTARFSFSGNDLELETVTVLFGGTGLTTLTSGNVLIGQGTANVDVSKAAPTGDFVGTTDTQTLTNKTLTDSSNSITSSGLFSDSGANTVSVNASANPTAGQVLTAINATTAEWAAVASPLTAGLGIDSTQLTTNEIIQLDTTARFSFSGNDLELETVTVPFGGTGLTTLTSGNVLVGQGASAVDVSKAAPTGDFVGTTDTQSLTNKILTDSSNSITSSGLFSDSGANTISVDASANPSAGQVLTALNSTSANWQDSVSPLTAGLGIDSTELTTNEVIQLDTTARFSFSGNDLELETVTVPFGGTGQTTLTSGNVLIGQGVAAVDVSKAAPIGDFVGTTDIQTLTNKTLTSSTNSITSSGLFSDSGSNTISVDASANPSAGQVLTATNATTAEWQTPTTLSLTAGLGIDATQLSSDVVQLDTTARFSFSGNDLELETVTVPFGGTGLTTLTSGSVLIGQGTSAIDVSKSAPTGDFVGTTDTQTLTNKTITDASNDVTSSSLFSDSGANTVSVIASANPSAGQVLTAVDATTATWQDQTTLSLTAGLGIDVTQLASDVVQLDTTARFSFSGNDLELETVTVPFGGTGLTTLTSGNVLIGQGTTAVDVSKAAPVGDFVGTIDPQSLTNKTLTDSSNDITASGIFSNNGANTISVDASANPTAGQVLTAINATTAEWEDSTSPLTAGLGIDSTELASDIIQLDTTARFSFSGNDLELETVTVPFGGTGDTTLTLGNVLVGQGTAAVDTSKAAPSGDFVGTTDTQTLTNKSITDASNDVTCTGLFSNNGLNTVFVDSSGNPTAGQVLTAIDNVSAEWQDSTSPLTAGLGIDSTQLSSDIIQLDTTARFSFSGNDLELETVTVPFGGTGLTTLTSGNVLIGQGAAAVDVSKAAPTGDFVGTTDTQTLTNKTLTDSSNNVTASALFSDNGNNTILLSSAGNPIAGQVLTAASLNIAEWTTPQNLSAGLGIDSNEILFNQIIQLDTTARFSFSGNDLELETVTVPFGGTGLTTLTSGNVLIGQGAGAVDVSKAAPTGDFVGTTDTQTLTNKTLTDSSNIVTASALFSNNGLNTVSVSASGTPGTNQVLAANNSTSAEWREPSGLFTTGGGIDNSNFTANNDIELDITTRFSFSGTQLELETVTVPFGGTGLTTLTSGNVLVGQGTTAVDTSKAAPIGDFVGTTDAQIFVNKTMTDASNDVTSTGLFSNSGANTVSVDASANPTAGQVLTATNATTAEWQTPSATSLSAGLGIDATQLASDVIQLDTTARFSFSGNDLELETVTVPFGGTGLTTLTSGNVLVGQGAAAVDVSKAAPTGDFVGTTDTQTLTNKTLTDSSNNVTASSLFSDNGNNTILLSSAGNPSAGQYLMASGLNAAEWSTIVSPLSAGLGIDSNELLLNQSIQLDTTARFSFSGNDLELETVTVPFGGTGLTTLTSGNVLVGQGAAAIDVSKAAPTGDFVGTTDTQTLTNKTLTDSSNNVTASSLFSDNGNNTIIVSTSANPGSNQVLAANNSTSAEWREPSALFTTGQGIDTLEFIANNNIQLSASSRFTFVTSGLDLELELETVTVPFGGTGQTTLTSGNVLVGQGAAAVDTSKAAPTGDFVGTTDTQTLTSKTLTASSNNVTATGLFSDNGANTVSVNASADPTEGFYLTATSATTATWQRPGSYYYGFDNTGGVSITTARQTLVYGGILSLGPDFTLSGTNPQIINEGTYLFSYTVSLESDGTIGPQRSKTSAILQRNNVDVEGTLSLGYMREQATGVVGLTMSKTIVIGVNVVPATFRVQFFENLATQAQTVADASSFTIVKLFSTTT